MTLQFQGNGRLTRELSTERATDKLDFSAEVREAVAVGILRRLFRRQQAFSMDPADLEMWNRSRRNDIRNICHCFPMESASGQRENLAVKFHTEQQNTSGEAWGMLEEMIRAAASKGSKEFAPGLEMPPELWAQIITLPRSIAHLKKVKKLYLYGSYLVRIPPAIGEMTDLEELDLYTSYRLHWLPFEVTRCRKLKGSRVSTRALYGNYKYRPNFPSLEYVKTEVPSECSVCGGPITANEVQQVWLSLLVATDVIPLLVNACSGECIRKLPKPAKGYVDHPHKGGLELVQPDTEGLKPQ